MTADAAPAPWPSELAQELERLRAELAEERARGRARAAELESVERDLRRLLRPWPMSIEGAEALGGGDTGAGPSSEHIALRAAHEGGARMGLTPLALLPALLLGFVARPWLVPSETPVRARGEARIAHANGPAVATPPALAARAETAAAVPASLAEHDAAALDGAEDGAPGPGAGIEASAALDVSSGDFAGRLTARAIRPLDYAAVDAPKCAFGGHAADLGPCSGPPTLAGDGVAGTHRVDGVDCCHHHQLVQRLGGDVAQLTAAAELARQEGVVPPLVAARVDRAVELFLRARFGAGHSSGVGGVLAEGHRVHVDAEGTATVETWIELEGTAAAAEPSAAANGAHAAGPGEPAGPRRRNLRLVLEVSDGADGDVLLEVATLAGAPEVAAGGTLVAPGDEHVTAGTNR